MKKLLASILLCTVVISGFTGCGKVQKQSTKTDTDKLIQYSIKLNQVRPIPRVYKGRIIH